MKSYQILVRVQLDETNVNAPSLDDLILCIENEINTPDNELYGISRIIVDGEEIENFMGDE